MDVKIRSGATALLLLVGLIVFGAGETVAFHVRNAPPGFPDCEGVAAWGTAYRTVFLEQVTTSVPPPQGYNPPNRPSSQSWTPTTPRDCVMVDGQEIHTQLQYYDQDGPDPPTCPPLTVNGRLFVLDSNGQLLPLRWAEVYVWDIDLDPTLIRYIVELLASGLTDADGFFSLAVGCNREVTDQEASRLDIIVHAVARSSRATVSRWYIGGLGASINDVTNFIYSGVTLPFRNADPNDSGQLPIGNWVAGSNDLRWAMLAYRKVIDAWEFLANGGSNYVVPHVAIHYLGPCTADPRKSCGLDGQGVTGEPFPHYMVAGGDCKWPDRDGVLGEHPDDDDCPNLWRYLDWQIHLDHRTNVQSRHVIAHLYGHFVMQRLFVGWYPGVGPLHGDCSIGGSEPGCESKDDTQPRVGDFEDLIVPLSCNAGSYLLTCQERLSADFGVDVAWVEGWADYFAMRVTGAASSDGTYTITRRDGSSWTVNFETPQAYGWSGEADEGMVGAVLHDVFDDVQDTPGGFEVYAGGWPRSWNAFSARTAANVAGYWSNWVEVFQSDPAQVRGARLSVRHNNIEYWASMRETTAVADSVSPAISADALGNYHIVWRDNRDGNFEVYYSKLDANWVPVVEDLRLTSTSTDALDPAIAVSPDGSRVYVVWSENQGVRSEIYQASYSSGTWRTDVVSNPNDHAFWDFGAFQPSVAVDRSGRAYYAWREVFRGGCYPICQAERIMVRTGMDLPQIRIFECEGAIQGNDYLLAPDIAVGFSGQLYVVFTKVRACPSGTGATFYSLRFNGNFWEGPTVLGSDSAVAALDYVVRVDADPAGNVLAVWQGTQSNQPHVWYTKGIDDGSMVNWQPPVSPTTWGVELAPDVAFEAPGIAYMAFWIYQQIPQQIVVLRSTDGGGTWPESIGGIGSGSNPISPRVAGEGLWGRVGLVHGALFGSREVMFTELSFAKSSGGITDTVPPSQAVANDCGAPAGERPLLKWTPFSDSWPSSGLRWFHLELSTDSSFSDPAALKLHTHVVGNRHATPFLASGTYYWRVKAEDNAGNQPSSWSTPGICSVVVQSNAVAPPGGLGILRDPPNTDRLRLSWNAVPGADSYRIYESQDRIAAYQSWDLIGEVFAGQSLVFKPTGQWDGLQHFYVVRTVQGGLESPASTMAAKTHLNVNYNPSTTNVVYFSRPYSSTYTQASAISSELTSSKIDVVAKWNPATQSSVVWLFFRGEWTGTDFSIGAGDGLYIGAVSSFPWVLVGIDPSTTLSLTLNPPPTDNYNWLSLPHTSRYQRSSDIVIDIEGSLGSAARIAEVATWDARTQTLLVFAWSGTQWTGSDFDVVPGDGIYLKIASSFTWEPKNVSPMVP